MIFVKGYGQMCNNILQYAHIYAWGRENGIKVLSMRFSYKYQYFELCKNVSHNWGTYLFAKTLINTHLIKHLWLEYANEVTSKDIEDLKNDKLIGISGWGFRHPELFFKYEDEIKQQFTIQEKFRKPVDEYLASCNQTDIKLAVHIRRGDYARFLGGKYYFDDDTYIRNIREFINLFPGKSVSVFISTNDKNLDIKKYQTDLNSQDVHLFKGSEIEDLYLLSQCDYIIGAKSTFSLVASYYRHIPLYHMEDKNASLTLDKFKYFEDIFMTV